MTTTESRNYNCKDEELPMICRFTLSDIRRDFEDFANFSPLFNTVYVDEFSRKIDIAEELVSPKMETEEVKKITAHLYGTMNNLVDPLAKLRIYLQLGKDTIGISAKDFGLSLLSRKINFKDAEGVHQNLLFVNAHIQKYWNQLKAVGFPDAIAEQFKNAVISVREDNENQFSIISKRKAIVQNNLKSLNELYAQLMEILNTGKALYKYTNPTKAKEYMFNSLLKNVRIVKKK
jgi:hypothetical protein